jgi:hypothetical protein
MKYREELKNREIKRSYPGDMDYIRLKIAERNAYRSGTAHETNKPFK